MSTRNHEIIASLRNLLSDTIDAILNTPMYAINFSITPQNMAEHIADMFYSAIPDNYGDLDKSDVYIGAYTIIGGNSFLYCAYKQQQVCSVQFHKTES